jgi:hypothetical protein
MDMDEEVGRAKWLLLSGVMFLVSCFICYAELRYLISGREVQATVTKVTEVTQRRRYGLGESKHLSIEYAFQEPNGTMRKGEDSVGLDSPLARGPTVPVQYTPGGDGRSRLVGHVHWVGIAVFVISVSILGVAGWRLWREASQPFPSRRSGRRR